MSMDCGLIRERIPDWIAGRLPEDEAARVAAHVPDCSECAEEARLVELIHSARPEVPEGLVERVVDAAMVPQRSTRPWWGLAAAAVAAIALGINFADVSEPGVVPAFASVEAGEFWLSDDGLIAGAPALDDLSDEALQALLDEISGGGAA